MSDGRDIDPNEVFEDLRNGGIILVDVREPAEFAFERIHGALLHPLSTFDARSLPTDSARRIMFQCGSGKRSRKALDAFIAETGVDAAHMAGGIGAWKQANLPCVRINSSTGQVEDHGRY